jgi:hypothetical protein
MRPAVATAERQSRYFLKTEQLRWCSLSLRLLWLLRLLLLLLEHLRQCSLPLLLQPLRLPNFQDLLKTTPPTRVWKWKLL